MVPIKKNQTKEQTNKPTKSPRHPIFCITVIGDNKSYCVQMNMDTTPASPRSRVCSKHWEGNQNLQVKFCVNKHECERRPQGFTRGERAAFQGCILARTDQPGPQQESRMTPNLLPSLQVAIKSRYKSQILLLSVECNWLHHFECSNAVDFITHIRGPPPSPPPTADTFII